MDREFCLYLIEMLDEQLPIRGGVATLDFADTDRIDTYHINASLHLAIPLSVTAHQGGARHVVEDVAIVDLCDEEQAIEALAAWCEAMRSAMQEESTQEIIERLGANVEP